MSRDSSAEFSFATDQPLCAVTFIWDYYQLLIGTFMFSIYSHPRVQKGGEVLGKDDARFRDSLCAQIGSNVVNTSYSKDELILCFSNDVRIIISLRKADRVGDGPESLEVSDSTGSFIVEGDSSPAPAT